MNKKLVSISILLALSASAHAAVKSGVIIGGKLGLVTLNTDKDIDANNHKVGGLGYGLYVGYDYAVTDNVLVGLELGYQNNGHSSFGQNPLDIEVNSTSWDLMLKGLYQFDSGWNVFAKAGAARTTQSYAGNWTPHKPSDVTKVQPKIALGGGYVFKSGLGVFAEYGHTFGSELTGKHIGSNTLIQNFDKVSSVNSFMVGMQYKF